MTNSPRRAVMVLHQQVDMCADASEQDVLTQRDAVVSALQALGHSVEVRECELDLSELRATLLEVCPDLVFNLVESLAGTDRLMPVVPLLLETLRLPFTGAGSRAICLTGDKLTAKQILCARALPTPACFEGDLFPDADPLLSGEVILKASGEHASFGMQDDCVGRFTTREALASAVSRRNAETGRTHFAEQFVGGREFNVSLLARGAEVDVLPVAEIDFSNLAESKPRIVGYAAKWDETSAEYALTPRLFPTAPADQSLLNSLREMATRCWRVFGLRGYARVDFRVDHVGQPWILEINANPCLSPDAGFAAALAQAGIPYEQAIGRILEAANDSAMSR